MRRFAAALALLLLTACVPATPPQQFPGDCESLLPLDQAMAGHWLKRDDTWRLRQSALLQLGTRKIALEGFLRLDLKKREARLLAMNEVGIVMFDLHLDEEGQKLIRAVPQLQKLKGFDQGVAQSLRRIFFHTPPEAMDEPVLKDSRQRLTGGLGGDQLTFDFDCRGDLRTVRQRTDKGDWRVAYEDYRPVAGIRVPQQVALNDYDHALSLTLWMREARLEP